MRHSILLRLAGAVLLAGLILDATDARSAEHSLSLRDALRLALHGNETLVSARENAMAADANEMSATGAYDPTLELNGDALHSTEPSNAPFPVSAAYPIAPDTRSAQVGLNLRQFIGTGGTVTLRGTGSRQTTDGALALLTPAYGAQVGAEFRQPLPHPLRHDAAVLLIRFPGITCRLAGSHSGRRT